MLYEVYFNDSDRCTLAGHFDEPGSLEELEACVRGARTGDQLPVQRRVIQICQTLPRRRIYPEV